MKNNERMASRKAKLEHHESHGWRMLLNAADVLGKLDTNPDQGYSEKRFDRLTSLPWSSQVLQQTWFSVFLDVSAMLDVYWIHESKTIQ